MFDDRPIGTAITRNLVCSILTNGMAESEASIALGTEYELD